MISRETTPASEAVFRAASDVAAVTEQLRRRCTREAALWRRHLKKLTAFEKRTGWKYSVIATNVRYMWGIVGSHQPQWLGALARAHAVVEGRVSSSISLRLSPDEDQSRWRGEDTWPTSAWVFPTTLLPYAPAGRERERDR